MVIENSLRSGKREENYENIFENYKDITRADRAGLRNGERLGAKGAAWREEVTTRKEPQA